MPCYHHAVAIVTMPRQTSKQSKVWNIIDAVRPPTRICVPRSAHESLRSRRHTWLGLRRTRGWPRTRPHEAAARKKSDKARVISIDVPLRINRQEYEIHVSRGIGLFEPLEHPFALAEASVHERQPGRRNIPFPPSLFQRPKHLAGFAVATQRREYVPSGCDGHMTTAREPRGAHDAVQGCVAPAKQFIGLSLLGVANPELRADHSCPLCVFKGRGIVASLQRHYRRYRVVHRIQRVELSRTAFPAASRAGPRTSNGGKSLLMGREVRASAIPDHASA